MQWSLSASFRIPDLEILMGKVVAIWSISIAVSQVTLVGSSKSSVKAQQIINSAEMHLFMSLGRLAAFLAKSQFLSPSKIISLLS